MEKYDFWHFQIFFPSLSLSLSLALINGSKLIVIHRCRRARRIPFLSTEPRFFFSMFNGEHSFVIITKRTPFEWNEFYSIFAHFTCESDIRHTNGIASCHSPLILMHLNAANIARSTSMNRFVMFVANACLIILVCGAKRERLRRMLHGIDNAGIRINRKQIENEWKIEKKKKSN